MGRRTHAAAVAMVGLLAAIIAVLTLGTGPAEAATNSVNVVVRDNASGKGFADIRVTLTGTGGFSAECKTDADGRCKITVPAAGSYKAAIDTATLPANKQPESADRSVTVFDGLSATAAFNLGEGAVNDSSTFGRVAQLATDGLLLGLVIAMGAIGLSLIYGTTGLTNFSHGELLTAGALVTYIFNNNLGLNFILSAVLAVLICGLLGGVQDRLLWRPLRHRGTGLIAMLVVSIGFGITVRNIFLFIFGGSTTPFATYTGQAGIAIGPVLVTPKALIGSAVGILLILSAAFWLLRTRMGKASRAISDNPALAAASGIDVERVINVVWILGAGLAAYGGILYSLGPGGGVNVQQGFQILLLIFAGVTLGGLGTAFGALVGSIIVGLLLQLGTLVIPVELQNVGALVILILILLVRPQGILGRRQRVG